MATLYHYFLGEPAPYPFWSAPVLLGTVGGVGLLVGPAGLLWLNLKRHPLQGDAAQNPMDRGFIALLLLTSATGLALLAGRDTGAMALLLAIHLGVVMALFLTLPLRQVRAWRVPLRGAVEVVHREAPAEQAAAGIGLVCGPGGAASSLSAGQPARRDEAATAALARARMSVS